MVQKKVLNNTEVYKEVGHSRNFLNFKFDGSLLTLLIEHLTEVPTRYPIPECGLATATRSKSFRTTYILIV